MSHFKHLVLEDRITIQSDLHDGLSFKKIASHIIMIALQFLVKFVIILLSLMICGLQIVSTIAVSIMVTVRNAMFVTFASL